MLCPLALDIEALSPDGDILIDPALLKKHVRIDWAADDDLLQVYLMSAALWCEHATKRTIFKRSHRWVLREFPAHPCRILLPRGRTVSVEGIDYLLNGTTVTLSGPSATSPAGSDYQEDLHSDRGGILMPPRGSSWPVADCDVPAPVSIEFTAGWDADDVPTDLQHAMMFFVCDAFDLRGTDDFTPDALTSGGKRLAARNALVSPYMLPRIY